MLDLNTRYILNKAIVLRGIGTKFWALNVVAGNQYKLNEVSFFILNSLRTSLTIQEIVKLVLREYNVGEEEAVVDCEKILQIASENGIVEEV